MEHTDQGPPWIGGRGIRRSQPGLKRLRGHYSARMGGAVKRVGSPFFRSGCHFQVAIPVKAEIQRLQRHLFDRHSREGGQRFTSAEPNIQRLQRDLSDRHSRERGNPETSA
ncbi:hypothetical protein [Lysobacter capsici]|uniref:hypothetical protein n=1 Tax=Lysobacter capsici TaxID=435897 RepID=UPI001C005DD8|nr:hypothetical protein [Lysobacter capsici]QWF15146.1 hypothetical protein KME82_15190 [Lysobacter capsici]